MLIPFGSFSLLVYVHLYLLLQNEKTIDVPVILCVSVMIIFVAVELVFIPQTGNETEKKFAGDEAEILHHSGFPHALIELRQQTPNTHTHRPHGMLKQ